MPIIGVSVIIPTHNRRKTLAGAVESVWSQTFRDWELLIVDDGSSDGTYRDWSESGDPRIRYLRTEHRGVSAARNLGIQQAKFPWISFLDSDDTWLPKKLETQLAALKFHSDYLAVHSDEIWIRRGRRVNPKKIHRKYGGWVYRYSLPRCVISPSSILISRQLLDRCGVFDETFPVCEDYELWLRMFARHPICFVDRPLLVKTGGHADQLEHLGARPFPNSSHGEDRRKRDRQPAAGGLDGRGDRSKSGNPGRGVRETRPNGRGPLLSEPGRILEREAPRASLAVELLTRCVNLEFL